MSFWKWWVTTLGIVLALAYSLALSCILPALRHFSNRNPSGIFLKTSCCYTLFINVPFHLDILQDWIEAGLLLHLSHSLSLSEHVFFLLNPSLLCIFSHCSTFCLVSQILTSLHSVPACPRGHVKNLRGLTLLLIHVFLFKENKLFNISVQVCDAKQNLVLLLRMIHFRKILEK